MRDLDKEGQAFPLTPSAPPVRRHPPCQPAHRHHELQVRPRQLRVHGILSLGVRVGLCRTPAAQWPAVRPDSHKMTPCLCGRAPHRYRPDDVAAQSVFLLAEYVDKYQTQVPARSCARPATWRPPSHRATQGATAGLAALANALRSTLAGGQSADVRAVVRAVHPRAAAAQRRAAHAAAVPVLAAGTSAAGRLLASAQRPNAHGQGRRAPGKAATSDSQA